MYVLLLDTSKAQLFLNTSLAADVIISLGYLK